MVLVFVKTVNEPNWCEPISLSLSWWLSIPHFTYSMCSFQFSKSRMSIDCSVFVIRWNWSRCRKMNRIIMIGYTRIQYTYKTIVHLNWFDCCSWIHSKIVMHFILVAEKGPQSIVHTIEWNGKKVVTRRWGDFYWAIIIEFYFLFCSTLFWIRRAWARASASVW